MRAVGAIHRVRTLVGDAAWLVTGYAEVRELLDDDRLGSPPQAATAATAGAAVVVEPAQPGQ